MVEAVATSIDIYNAVLLVLNGKSTSGTLISNECDSFYKYYLY